MREIAPPTIELRAFLVRFGVATAAVVGALALLPSIRDGMTAFTVWSIHGSAGLLGLQAWPSVDGVLAFGEARGATFVYRIAEECAGTAVVGLFVVAVFAVPAVPWRRRVIGLVAGSFLLLTINWVRLLHLAWVGVRHPDLFTPLHVWVWPALTMAALVGLWAIWIRWVMGYAAALGVRRAGALWLAGVGTVGAVLHLTPVVRWYADLVMAAAGLLRGAVEMLPYYVFYVPRAGAVDVSVDTASAVLAIALTAALTGPVAGQRIRSIAWAVPVVFAAQVIGTLIGQALLSRWAWSDASESMVPLALLLVALPLVVPMALGYRAQMARSRVGAGHVDGDRPLVSVS